MELFENIWFVGIGGGIVSGFIVYFVTNWFFSRKDNSERIKLAHQANDEVVNILKPYIADKGLPEIEVVNALISSVARKFKLDTSELYSVEYVCEELIREIISNVYVSCDKKVEYTQQLADYAFIIKRSKTTIESRNLEKEIFQRNSSQLVYRKKLNSRYTLLFSMYASIIMLTSIVILGLISDNSNKSTLLDLFGSEYQLIYVFISMILVTVVFVMVMTLLIDSRNRNRIQKARNLLMHGVTMHAYDDDSKPDEPLE